MNARLLCVAVHFVSACTKQVDVSAIEAGKDYSGLSNYERTQFEWAALDVAVSPEVASSLRRWELSNLSLYLFRCEEPDDFSPPMLGWPVSYFVTRIWNPPSQPS